MALRFFSLGLGGRRIVGLGLFPAALGLPLVPAVFCLPLVLAALGLPLVLVLVVVTLVVGVVLALVVRIEVLALCPVALAIVLVEIASGDALALADVAVLVAAVVDAGLARGGRLARRGGLLVSPAAARGRRGSASRGRRRGGRLGRAVGRLGRAAGNAGLDGRPRVTLSGPESAGSRAIVPVSAGPPSAAVRVTAEIDEEARSRRRRSRER